MVSKVLSDIRRYEMLCPGDSVLVALSGGADSMSLLSVLLSLRDELQITVSAAHVNHCLRGEESDRDEVFVKNICDKRGVKLYSLKTDVSAEAEKTGEGTEECGRRIRYAFFESIDNISKIATAHTLSDHLETVLFNLTRGSGLNGLCGIPPMRGKIIRPLIGRTRVEVEAYCAENDIPFVTDMTNLENDYNRNKIRHLIIPRLKEINPSVESAVGRCTESLTEDEDFLVDCAGALIEDAAADNGYSADKLLAAHPAVRKRALMHLLREQMTEKPQKHHIDLLDAALQSGGAVQTQAGVTAVVKDGLLLFDNGQMPLEPWRADIVGDTVGFPYGIIKISKINISESNKTQKICKQVLANCLDYDKIAINSFFRSRVEGDKISQPNGSCTKTLKKLFNEKRIPAAERNGVVVLADDVGVLWVEGCGCDRRAMITDATRTVMMIGVERDAHVN